MAHFHQTVVAIHRQTDAVVVAIGLALAAVDTASVESMSDCVVALSKLVPLPHEISCDRHHHTMRRVVAELLAAGISHGRDKREDQTAVCQSVWFVVSIGGGVSSLLPSLTTTSRHINNSASKNMTDRHHHYRLPWSYSMNRSDNKSLAMPETALVVRSRATTLQWQGFTLGESADLMEAPSLTRMEGTPTPLRLGGVQPGVSQHDSTSVYVYREGTHFSPLSVAFQSPSLSPITYFLRWRRRRRRPAASTHATDLT